MVKVIPAALLYALVFHYAYVAYINPAFEYAHYDYYPPSFLIEVITYLSVLAPLLLYRRSQAPAATGASLIFVLCYVPAQLIILFTWQESAVELQTLQWSLAGSMAALFWASRMGVRSDLPPQSERRLKPVMFVATAVTMAVIVAVFRDHMRLVSFADVYDLRFEASEVETSPLVDYPMLWLSYCFLPFFLALGFHRHRVVYLAWALIGCVIIYAATGAKAVLLMPVIIFAVYILTGAGSQLLLRLLLIMTVTVVLIIELLPNEGALLWVKSILLVRILGTAGWNMSKYYEYFGAHDYTYYTHIGPVNALTDAYPYGERSLGQVIGFEYTGDIEANFNANFWASDAFAALGVPGIPLVTVAMCAVFFAINRFSSGYSKRFVTLWLAGFWLALLNLPLTTALLSGGGALVMLLLWAFRRKRRRPRQVSVDAAELAVWPTAPSPEIGRSN
jgi:hypothetical protein